jgi:hypothetical protein
MSKAQDVCVPFDALADADLIVDAVYEGGTYGNVKDDPIAHLLPVGNQGGFRYKGSPRGNDVRFVALYSTGLDPDWPDELDPQSGQFVYFGDNKKPGTELHTTGRSGNELLRSVFEMARGTPEQRLKVPPFLLFQKAGDGRAVRFRGLLAPGAESLPGDDELVAIWRSTGGLRFQNYRAVFTVLDVPVVTREWINELKTGTTVGPLAPLSWKQWVEGRHYAALEAPSTTVVRTKQEQTPTGVRADLLAVVKAYFEDDPHGFEACAVELWKMLSPATGRCELTRRSRDGGRDAVGVYELGPKADRVAVEFALEAKCYAPGKGVGVRDMARLISRLRHRQFGVFVTTSHFDQQAYTEVREDGHPVVLLCGKDIADILMDHGYTTPAAVKQWLQATFPGSATLFPRPDDHARW